MKKSLIMLAIVTFALHGCADQGAVAKAKADADAAMVAQTKAEAALAKAEAELAKAKADLETAKAALGPRTETETKLIGGWTAEIPDKGSPVFSDLRFRADGTCDVVMQVGGLGPRERPNSKYTVTGNRILIELGKDGSRATRIQSLTDTTLVLLNHGDDAGVRYARIK